MEREIELVTVNEQVADVEETLQLTTKLFSQPMLFEKSLSQFHLPSKLTMILAALFVGPLGNFLFLFAISFDLPKALYTTFVSLNAGVSGLPLDTSVNWYSFIGNISWYVFLFYVVFSIRHLRLNLAKLEPQLVSLTVDGGKALIRIFQLVSHHVPQLVITAIFLVIYGTFVPSLIIEREFTLLSAPIFVLRSFMRSLMFGSILWLCFASLWSLYRFGKHCPRFKSYLEDPMLGTGVLGAMSFTLSKTYFLALSIFSVQMILGELAGNTLSINLLVMFVLIPAGIALFLAPLVCTHKRMVEMKKNELQIIRRRFADNLSHVTAFDQKDEGFLTKLLMLESLERKATAISTWPVESPVTGKFVAILTSVSAILLARYIQLVLHI